MGAEKIQVQSEVKEAYSQVRDTAFLCHFSDEFVDSLMNISQVISFEKEHELTRERQVNDGLYILLNGEVTVTVGGELISNLSDPGEVFGEMSLIAEIPCSATVQTTVASQLVKIEHADLQALLLQDLNRFVPELYKVFSKVLTHRLVLTNDKARRFELAHKELKQLHRELDELNRRKMEEISSFSSKTIEKVHQIYNQDLSQFEKAFLDLEDGEKLLPMFNQIKHKIKPISELHRSEKLFASKRVLLVEPDIRQQRIAKMALRGSGLEIDIAASVDECQKYLTEIRYDLMMFSEEVLDVASKAYEKHPDMKQVLMTSAKVPDYVQYFYDHPYLTDVVSRNPDDRTFTIKNIFTTVGKISSEDIFGIEKYLSWGAEVFSSQVSRSDERSDILDKMAVRFKELGIRETIVERCRIVGEEMIMNAIYDAPVGPDRAPLFNHLDRTNSVVLAPEQQGFFRYACDGVVAAISIEDPFGAFERETLMAYLSGCYAGEKTELHEGKGGGGMGIHLMVETSDLTVFNIQKGFRTEVIALFNIDASQRKNLKFPSFHLFYR